MNAVEKSKIVTLLKQGQRLAYDAGDIFERIVSFDDEGFRTVEDFHHTWKHSCVQDIVSLREAYHPHRAFEVDEVVTKREGMHEEQTIREHPSQGNIRFSRVNGQAQLFDSELEHQSFISLTVSTAKVQEDQTCHRDVYADEELMEVWLSEVQFARAITSLNSGTGTPCSLHRIDGNLMPEPPKRESPIKRHNERLDELKTRLKGVIDQPLEKLKELQADRKRPTMKQLDAIIRSLEISVSNSGENAVFAQKVLVESMQDTVNACKTEVDGYVHNTLVKAGLEKIAENFKPLLLDTDEATIKIEE